jgi:hypothetical protein
MKQVIMATVPATIYNQINAKNMWDQPRKIYEERFR